MNFSSDSKLVIRLAAIEKKVEIVRRRRTLSGLDFKLESVLW